MKKPPHLRVVRADAPAWWDDKNNRAMVICRVSDKKQEDGESPDMQKRINDDYASEKRLDVVCVRTFTESAKDSESRKEFHAAIDEALRRKIKHVIFYVWDRVARNNTDAEKLERLILGKEIIVHGARLDRVLHAGSSDADWEEFERAILNAKLENRGRRTKTIDGMNSRALRGWAPAKVPWFYWHQPAVDEEGRLKKRGGTIGGPTEEGRRLLRREMELHLAGSSLDRIRETCLAEGLVPAKYIPRYRRSAIDKHLKNIFFVALDHPRPDPKKPDELFKSQLLWRGKVYPAKHEPVFTHDEGERLKASFGLKSTYRKSKHRGLFTQGPLVLACADPECGCRITYAPKTKPSGITYGYYRCADGRRIHKERGEPQVNVLEDVILQQLGTAVDAIGMTAEIAEAIATELSATHRKAMASKARSAEAYRAEIAELEDREDRLFDRFDKNEVDKETYYRQVARLRAEKKDRFDKLEEANHQTDDAYLVTAERVLELAIKAKTLWEGRSPTEKRDLLERLVCNPRLDGRSVRFDLKKPFAVLAQMHGEEGWRPQQDSNLRPQV